jgi:Asp-tRNA(Asn)/Glu-tRNA(Gln) amidotransferase A subunit family amidase
MEWLRFLREIAWHNAGFGSVRKIRGLIEDFEPWFEPTIIPLPEDEHEEWAEETSDSPAVDRRTKYPDAKYYSVEDYRKMYLSGELTPTDVAKSLLPLIQRDMSPAGPHSIAWFETQANLVLTAAEASTLRYQQKCSLGPLDGVPTAVKDEYEIQGYKTNLGSRNDYTGTILEQETSTSWCVRQLEAAGAIILGKLSMHEFGLDTTGNNPVHGTPPNPHNDSYYTGGSSSGTGYAVSTGLIPIGLGSDGGGSIRIPASMCGVLGLKPTHGRLSFRPGQNHCPTCAVLGPLAADVRSLATVFQTVAAPHTASEFPPLRTLRLTASPTSDQPKFLGLHEKWFAQADPAVQRLCKDMINRLVADHGYTVVPITIPFLNEGQKAHAITVLADAATLLPDTKGLTWANRLLLALGRTTPATDLVLAAKLRRVLMRHLAYLWQQHPGMLIITPTTACAGWKIKTSGELKYGLSDGDQTLRSMEYVWLANFCGLPALSVPAGFIVPEGKPNAGEIAAADVEGKIPIGLMAMGEWCSEEQLLQFGLVAEQLGADKRARPPIWVDVIKEAKKGRADAQETNGA